MHFLGDSGSGLADAQPPTAVAAVFAAWREYEALTAKYHAKLAEIRGREVAARGLDPAASYVSILDTGYDFCYVAKAARLVLVAEGAVAFAAPGGRLDIPVESVSGFFGDGNDQFDPTALWADLRRRYGSGKGIQTVYREAARNLALSFRIKPGEEQKLVGGRVVVSTLINSQSAGYVLSQYSQSALEKLMLAINTLGEWSGLWTDVERAAVKRALAIFRGYICTQLPGGDIAPREAIGDNILIVPFRSKWEFRLSPRLAEQLQLFIAEFGGLDER